jgi:hypothetical protein
VAVRARRIGNAGERRRGVCGMAADGELKLLAHC